MKPDVIRLLASLLLSATLAVPAVAQVRPSADTEKTAASQAGGDSAEDEEDNDAEDPAELGGAAQTYDATGKFDYGFAGLLARDNRTDLAPLTLASGQPVAGDEYTLKSGGYYRIDITADGSQELALSGGDFFRAVWVNEIVVNDIEIRPTGLHSLEFDDAGTVSMSFVAIVPGRYTLSIPGSQGETQQAVFTIQ